MATTAPTYAQIKAAMAKYGIAVSSGSTFTSADLLAYKDQFVPAACYKGGVASDKRDSLYGLPYPAVLPAAISNAITAGNYSATLAGSPLTGTHGTTAVTWTLTETGGPGTSYAWDFGDGNTTTTTVPNATHTYAAAGSFTAKVTPTVAGVVEAKITAAAPAVIS